jgi:hypothetical protein
MTEKPMEKGEIMRHAVMLVNSMGDRAVDHAHKMAERMQESGDEEDQKFWSNIVQQVELLVLERPPD